MFLEPNNCNVVNASVTETILIWISWTILVLGLHQGLISLEALCCFKSFMTRNNILRLYLSDHTSFSFIFFFFFCRWSTLHWVYPPITFRKPYFRSKIKQWSSFLSFLALSAWFLNLSSVPIYSWISLCASMIYYLWDNMEMWSLNNIHWCVS